MRPLAGLLRILVLTFEVYAKSAVYLLAGFLLAGLVHVFLRGRSFGKNLTTRGLRSILSGMAFGLALPVCSCGVLPLAVAMKKRKATPEGTAAFAVATPDNSEDTILLTAGLLGPLFAAVRVVAGLVAGVLSGLFVIASEAWGDPEKKPDENGGPEADTCDGPRTEPAWYRGLVSLLLLLPRRLADRISRAQNASPAVPVAEEAAPAAATPTRPPLGRRIVDGTREVVRFGFREVLDEIAWPLLAGLVVSGFLAAALPEDSLARVPGGLLGQFLFAAVIAVPLYLCASASTPLGAVLLAKGLAPGAVLVLFLTGPVTNVPTVLLLRRHFGKRFLVSILLGTFLASVAFGMGLNALWPAASGGTGAAAAILEEGVSATDLFFAAILLVPLLGSLLRVGAREGWEQIASTFRGLVPAAARSRAVAAVSALSSLTLRRIVASGAVLAVLAWGTFGLVSVPQGCLGFASALGRVDPRPLEPGWRWHLPPPVGRVEVFPLSELVKVDLGFRAAGLPDPDADDWSAAGGSWHASYTTPGDNPEEASYATGDQNVIEAKVAIHLLVADPFALRFRTREGIDSVRAPALSVLRELLASRPIDGVLTRERGEVQELARRRLDEELARGKIPLKVVSLNLLDLHPPLGAVAAFRDVGSAAEDRERRIYEARALSESSLPEARGLAAQERARAGAESVERTRAAEGHREAFREQAAASRAAPAETRTRLRWETLERTLAGRRVVVAPRGTPHDVLDGLPASTPPKAGERR